jgi:2,3-dihydro-2,3-dihydroxybenzoate dehydrogenase
MELTGIRGTVSIVTGAAGGIGSAVARALGESGSRVAVTDIDGGQADMLADAMRAGGADATSWALDVTYSDQVERVVGEIEERLGPIAHLVNVAGIVPRGPMLELADADWDRLFAINTRGVFFCLRSVGRRMRERRAGAIVTIGSQGAILIRAGLAAYGASKSAAASLTKCLGIELAPYGIRCNVVHPGVTSTPPALERFAGDEARFHAHHAAGDPAIFRAPIPLGKAGRPEDAAATVLFLLSDQAGHITMEDIVVDGGATMIA